MMTTKLDAKQDAKGLEHDRLTENLLQSRKFLLTITRAQIIAASLAGLFYLFCTFFINSFFAVLLVLIVFAAATAWITERWVLRNSEQVSAATWFFLVTLFLVVLGFVIVVGVEYSSPLLFLWPLIVAILVNSVQAIIVIAACSIATTVILYIVHFLTKFDGFLPIEGDFSNFFHVFIWVLMLGMTGVGLILILRAFNNVNNRLRFEAQRLSELTFDMEIQRAVSSDVARQVLTTSNQLNVISQQQRSGLREQVTVVTEITSSIEELAAAAGHIASLAGQVLQAANLSGERVEPITQQADDMTIIAEQGLEALQNSRQASRLVAERFMALDQRLTELANRSSELTSVATIIKEIADETTLLALNAAIEAAGAGEYGQRFGVVAQEVKALANRAIESAEEVHNVLSRVSQLLVQASSDAQHGRLDAQQAAKLVVNAAQTISSLTEVVSNNAVSANEIKEQVQNVSFLAEQIDMATRQQRTASNQLVESMHQVRVAAQESAGGTSELTSTVVELEQLSTKLVGQLN